MRHILLLLSAALCAVLTAGMATPAHLSNVHAFGVDRRAVSPASQLTNAQRLARGMSPAQPKRRSTPARTRGRRQAEASPVPQVRLMGRIQVYNAATNAFLGYFHVQDAEHIGTPPQPRELAQIVSFMSPSSGPTNLQLEHVTDPIDDLNFLGLAEGCVARGPMGPGSHNYGEIGWSGETRPNSTPQFVGFSGNCAGAVESAVWNVDPLTGDITAHWVNPDGSKPVTHIVAGAGMYVTGDVPKFVADLHSIGYEVTWKFEVDVALTAGVVHVID